MPALAFAAIIVIGACGLGDGVHGPERGNTIVRGAGSQQFRAGERRGIRLRAGSGPHP